MAKTALEQLNDVDPEIAKAEAHLAKLKAAQAEKRQKLTAQAQAEQETLVKVAFEAFKAENQKLVDLGGKSHPFFKAKKASSGGATTGTRTRLTGEQSAKLPEIVAGLLNKSGQSVSQIVRAVGFPVSDMTVKKELEKLVSSKKAKTVKYKAPGAKGAAQKLYLKA